MSDDDSRDALIEVDAYREGKVQGAGYMVQGIYAYREVKGRAVGTSYGKSWRWS